MPANFRPEMSVIKDLKPFKFWCSKVLPSVYDDSLSYYELLTKVLRYLNDTMESVESLDSNVNNIYNAYLLLEDYVNNYFDNADFQQMVNDKLDAMAEDGTLTTLITTYVDPLFDQMTEDLDTAIENQNTLIDTAFENQNTLIDGRFNTQDTKLGVMESQMNEFIADHAGPAMAFTLWSGYADAVGTNITLSDDPANYDYIEVYLRTLGSSYCPSIHRFPAESFHSTPNLSVVQTEIGNNTNDTRLNEYRINIEPTDSQDDTKYRIRYSNHWLWTGTTDSDAINYENNVTDEQQASAGIVKIVGIKNVQNNAEVIDARIGANNTTYTTLGDAIRTQVTNLQYAINDRARIANSSSFDVINFQQGGNGAIMQVNVPSMTKFNSEISDLRSDIDDIESEIESGTVSGLTSAIKSALIQLAQKVVYIDDDGQQYYNDLYDALYPTVVYTSITLDTNSISFGFLNATQTLIATTTPVGGDVTWSSSDTSVATVSQTGVVTSIGYGNAIITAMCGNLSATCSVNVEQATVTSISAVYTQSGTVYDTSSLDSLKSDLVVTASWSNGATSTVADTDYTLSGTLTEGTSTVTVAYGGKTTTFNVNVTADPFPTGYTRLAYLWAKTNVTTSPVYIDLGFTPTANTSYEYKVSLDSTPSATYGGGHFLSCLNHFVPFIRYNSGIKIFAKRAGTEGEITFSNFVPNTEYTINAYRDGAGSVEVNGNVLGTVSAGSASASGTFSLFTFNAVTNIQAYLFIGKLFYLKIYENDVLVHDYVPCKNDNNVIGLFDMVNSTFVTSATQYTFTEPE